MFQSLDRETISSVVNNIVKAYKFIEESLGISLSRDVLEKILKEVEHIAIHELSHGVIHSVYPEITDLHHRDPIVAECIQEIGARLLELYISSKIGVYTHTFEEHIHELKHYTLLRDIDIKPRDLEELYRETVELIKEKKLIKAVENVVGKCMEWLRKS